MIRLFRVSVPAAVLMLLVTDLVLVTGSFLLATRWMIEGDFEIFLLYEDGLSRMSIVVASILLGMYFQNLYSELRVRSRILLFQQLALVIGVVFLVQALLTYISPLLMMPRWIMITGSVLVMVLVPFWRILYVRIGLSSIGSERVLFLGSSNVAMSIADRIRSHPEYGLVGVGLLDDDCGESETPAGLPLLGKLTDVRQAVADTRAERIVVGLRERRRALPVYDLLDLRFLGVRIEEAAAAYESTFGRVPVAELRPSQLIFSSELGPVAWNLRLQSIYSTLFAIVVFLVTVPVMLLVAVAVKLTSRGPVLFRQTRVGHNGVPFTLYKFRSMVADAEARTGAVWATRNDPRVTPLGRWLRKLRLDELPQLFNVLRGEMSIVGPRPERPEFVRTLTEQIPFYRQRHCVKPGVTGWAQVNYKYGETIEDTIIKLEYDLYYIKNLSLSLDLYILFHTIKVMLFTDHGQ